MRRSENENVSVFWSRVSSDHRPSIFSLEGGLDGLPLRATFSPAHPLADIFHPPHPPIASQSIPRDVPLTRARTFKFSPLYPKGSSQTVLHCAHRQCAFPGLYPYPARRLVWSPLRASSDHRFIVGALRAQRPYQLSRHFPSKLACPSFHRAAWLILECARRTRASCFLLCTITPSRPKGVVGLSFTARIGRAQFYRARSASKKDGLVAPYSLNLALFARRGTVDRASLSA